MCQCYYGYSSAEVDASPKSFHGYSLGMVTMDEDGYYIIKAAAKDYFHYLLVVLLNTFLNRHLIYYHRSEFLHLLP